MSKNIEISAVEHAVLKKFYNISIILFLDQRYFQKGKFSHKFNKLTQLLSMYIPFISSFFNNHSTAFFGS